MKLIMGIVNRDDVRGLVRIWVREGLRATLVSTFGGFLRAGNTTICVGTGLPK